MLTCEGGIFDTNQGGKFTIDAPMQHVATLTINVLPAEVTTTITDTTGVTTTATTG